jgi:hypothetical protein
MIEFLTQERGMVARSRQSRAAVSRRDILFTGGIAAAGLPAEGFMQAATPRAAGPRQDRRERLEFRGSFPAEGTLLAYTFRDEVSGGAMAGTLELGEYGHGRWCARKRE